MKNIWLTFALLTVSIALNGCSNSNSDRKGPARQTIFVKGDPALLIAGATLNAKSPITESNAMDWNDMRLKTIVTFEEKTKIDPDTDPNPDIKEENKPREAKGLSSSMERLQMSKRFDGRWELHLMGLELKLIFNVNARGDLDPILIADNSGHEGAIHVLHWSTHSSGNYVSLLFSLTGSESGRSLMVIYFEKPSADQNIERTDSKYIYIAGPGRKIGWPNSVNGNLEVQFCGTSEGARSLTEMATQKWNDVLVDRLKLHFYQTTSYAPFSDLNQHCVQLVDTYLFEARDNVMTYGITLTIASYRRAEIVDADIFIFKAEFEKIYKIVSAKNISSYYADKVIAERMPITFVHEMGHLLGLDHKFDGTLSIMSYDYNVTSPTTYDTEAVQQLYPKLH